MREIKFRGKDAKDKWVYGYYSRSQTGMHLIDTYAQFVGCKPTFVKPETVGQFTGLKDKHGVDIYEGDYRQFKQGVGVVVWDDCAFAILSPGSEAIDYEHSSVFIDSLLIGTIHDNPELLNEAK